MQSIKARFCGKLVAKFHHVVTNFYASYIGLALERVGKIVVEGKSEVTLATSHIGDGYGTVGWERIDMTAKYFDVVCDLFELVLRLGIYIAVGIGNSKQVKVFFAVGSLKFAVFTAVVA